MKVLDVVTLAAGYTPVDLTADLASGVTDVLPWIGAGIGGGVTLYFLYMGIRKGFSFFRGLAR